MAKLKLGVIVGSNRRESINRKLAQALANFGGDKFEAKFIQIDDLPIYNQDNEQPVPAPAARIKSEIEGSDALLFVTPEHSRSIPAVLKNAIDWGMRPWGKASYPGKPAAVIGTSGGVDFNGGRPAASQSRAQRSRPARHRRRSLYSVQARDDRRSGQCRRRDRAQVPQRLHRQVCRLCRPVRTQKRPLPQRKKVRHVHQTREANRSVEADAGRRRRQAQPRLRFRQDHRVRSVPAARRLPQ